MTMLNHTLGGPDEMTTTTARVATVHGGLGLPVQLALLDAIEAALHDLGVDRVWLDPASTCDLVVLAETDQS